MYHSTQERHQLVHQINECIDSSITFSEALQTRVFAVEQENIARETIRLRREAKAIVWEAVMASSEFCRANWPYPMVMNNPQDGALRNVNRFAEG